MGDFADIFSNTRALVLVILFFGGSIFVHELGHFLAARLRGLKILRFSVGFGPRIFSWRGGDGCEYILSLLPLGGYVALPQLADMGALEGGDGNGETEKLPKASCTDKIIVSAAGAFFNVLFAVLLAAIIWCVGITKNAAAESTVVGFVPEKISDVEGNQFPCPAKLAGVRAGDKIISIDGRTPSDFQQIIELVAIGSGRTADGKPLDVVRLIEEMTAAPSRLGLYTDYKTLAAVSDYNYLYETNYGTELSYGGYINRSQGCYVMDITGYAQELWNSYTEEKRRAAREGRAVDLNNVEHRTIYLGPEAYSLYTPSFGVLQGEAQTEGSSIRNHAPIGFDITYTMIR